MLDGHKEQMFGKPHQVRNPGEEQLHIQLQGLLHICSEREGSPQCCTLQQEIQVQKKPEGKKPSYVRPHLSKMKFD